MMNDLNDLARDDLKGYSMDDLMMTEDESKDRCD